MKIIGIKQLKTNMYEIIVEKSESFLLFDETILKYFLTVGKSISNGELTEIKKYDKLMNEYYLVVKSIKSKIKSKKEIYDILSKKNISDKEIFTIITKLENINLINDTTYLERYVSYKINNTNHGPKRIKEELLKKGINVSNIDAYLLNIDESIWNSKLEKIVIKKNKSNHKYSNKEFYGKLKLYLNSLGYYENQFISLINTNDDSDNELIFLEKEFMKQEKKLLRKNLDLNQLYYKIKTNLMMKGFKSSDIDNLVQQKKED